MFDSKGMQGSAVSRAWIPAAVSMESLLVQLLATASCCALEGGLDMIRQPVYYRLSPLWQGIII